MNSSYLDKIEFRDFLVVLILIGLIAIGFYYQYTAYEDDKRVDVHLLSDGRVVDTISARTATTPTELYTGLSDTETLGNGQGMIFIYDEQSKKEIVMRDMDFGLDIIFIDSNCSVNTIKHAEKPISGQSGTEPMHQYNASAQYVLELPYKYTEGEISRGDSVDFYEC